jgi:uncharacterized phage protein gp47/JayE
MPWSTPSLNEVRSLVRDAVRGKLPGADATIPNSVLRVISDAQGGLCHLNLQYIDWLALQLMPDTAELEWLDRFAAIWLINSDNTTGRKNSTAAHGSAAFTGTPLGVLPKYAQLTGGGAGADVIYETLSEMTIDETGNGECEIRAITYGTVGNLLPGASLGIINPPSDIDTAEVIELSGGTDVETDDQLRTRLLLRIRQPPMGGAAHDYVQWALAVPGVSRAWCAPLEQGMGTVTVRFMCDNLRATDDPLTNGFPLPEDILQVRAYLDFMRPVTTKDFQVVAPIPEPIDFRIVNLVEDTASVHGAIESSIDVMLYEKAAPAHAVGGIMQAAQTIYTTWVSCAILDAAGVDHFDLEMKDHIMPTNGSLAVRGIITWG